MKITSTSLSQLPAVPSRAAKTEPKQTSSQPAGWGPKAPSTERKVLEGVIDDAISLKRGATFNTRLGQAKHVAATFGKDSTKVVTERLASKLPAANADERARIYRAATTLGADSAGLKALLMKDAIKSGDAQLALELVHDGVSLSKADAAKLAPHVRGDEVLTSHDQTKSLSRAALSVLAGQPKQLEQFAASLSSAALLFGDVLANKDKQHYGALKPLVGQLTAKEADRFARQYGHVAELGAALRARAAQK